MFRQATTPSVAIEATRSAVLRILHDTLLLLLLPRGLQWLETASMYDVGRRAWRLLHNSIDAVNPCRYSYRALYF